MTRDLVFLAISLFLWGFGESMWYEFRPVYLQQLGADPLQIGAALGVIGAAMLFAHIPAGYLSDRFGRRPMIRVAWTVGVLATFVMAGSTSLPLFILGSVLYGFTYFVNGPLNSYITAAARGITVGRAMTLISASYSLGSIFGPLLGGWLGEQIGMRGIFFFAIPLFTVSAVLVYFLRPQPVKINNRAEHHDSTRQLFNRRFIGYLAIILLVIFVMYLPQVLTPNFLRNQRGLNLAQIGQILAFSGVGMVALNLVLGHFNAHRGFLLTIAALSGFTFFIWKGNGLEWYMLAYFLMGGYRAARSFAAAQGRLLLTDANMGMGYGMIETVMAGAVVLAPPLAGYLYQLDPELMYKVAIPGLVLAFCLALFFIPRRQKEAG